jgi:hypothetical protein
MPKDLQREYEYRTEREYQKELEARDRAEQELDDRIAAIKEDGGDIDEAIAEYLIGTDRWENALVEFMRPRGDPEVLKALINWAIKKMAEK